MVGSVVTAAVKVTDNPETLKLKPALHEVFWAFVLKVNAARVSNSSVNIFFINKILISNVVLVRGCCLQIDTGCFNNVA